MTDSPTTPTSGSSASPSSPPLPSAAPAPDSATTPPTPGDPPASRDTAVLRQAQQAVQAGESPAVALALAMTQETEASSPPPAAAAAGEGVEVSDAQNVAAAADTAPRRAMVETINLTKVYKNLVAVRELNLTINEGDLFGFIGPNGAGKTTTIRVLATLLRPTHGDAMVGGYSVRKDSREIRHIIGYMPDFFGTYEEMRVTEYLEFFAEAYRIPRHKRRQVVSDVLDLTDLGYKRDANVRSLSRGMQQRLGVARVLLHDPAVLLLDEPASGLDPRARIEMRALLKELQRMGKTILISSHILTELAEMCNAIGIVERGQLLYQGPVRDIVKKLRRGGTYEVDVAERREAAVQLLERHPDVLRAEAADDMEGQPFIRVKLIEGKEDPSFIAKLLVENAFALVKLKEEDLDLEDVFLQVTKGIVQ